MKFYCFPKQQRNFAIYSSISAFKSRTFKNFIVQLSAKNSVFFRVRNTAVGHFLGQPFTINIDTPKNSDFVGLVKDKRILLVEIRNSEPIKIWRVNNEGWRSETFKGFPLIEQYTIAEFDKKYAIIEEVLKNHWVRIKSNSISIHGDFTHFNVLISSNNEVNIIDEKPIENSALFDHFYFYAYLRQCIEKCSTLSRGNTFLISKKLDSIVKSVFAEENISEIKNHLDKIEIPDLLGLQQNAHQYLNDFKKLLLNKILL